MICALPPKKSFHSKPPAPSSLPSPLTHHPHHPTTPPPQKHRGQWVLIEDADRAPLEVLAALSPLLDTGRLPLPGRNDVARAHPNFRLFGTITTGEASTLKPLLGGLASLSHAWAYLRLRPLPAEEVGAVMQGTMCSLSRCLMHFIVGLTDSLSPYINPRVLTQQPNPYTPFRPLPPPPHRAQLPAPRDIPGSPGPPLLNHEHHKHAVRITLRIYDDQSMDPTPTRSNDIYRLFPYHPHLPPQQPPPLDGPVA